ncbi:MAG: tetratricopeptide repeat-containing sensor histidine kinase [Candidatus Cloacimonetes bacterium]|nr:tetratricopeptide repeat-containing sensor histidine kinase [Candidatus Cloacimonadota bacterium]
MANDKIQILIEEYTLTKDLYLKVKTGKDLCIALSKNGRYEEGLKYGYEILMLAEEIKEDELLFYANIGMGLIYFNQAMYNEAKYYFQKALDKAFTYENKNHIAQAYNNLGTIHLNSGIIHSAIEYYTKGISLIEQIDQIEDIQLLIGLYVGIGNAYVSIKEIGQAQEYFKKTIRIKEPAALAISYFNIGCIYNDQNDFALALGYFKRSYKIYETENNIYFMFYCSLNIGTINLKRERYDSALQTGFELLEFSKKYNNKVFLVNASLLIARVYTQTGEYEKACEYFNQIKEHSSYADYNEFLVDYYENYALFLYKTEKYQEACDYSMKLKELMERIAEEDFTTNKTYLMTKFEAEQKQKEIEIYRLKNVELANTQTMIKHQIEELIHIKETQDNLLVMISHDLKNYIGGITQTLDVLGHKDKILSENKYIQQISTLSNKSMALVREIMSVNKLSIETDAIPFVEHDLNEVIEMFSEHLVIMAQNKNIDMSFEYHTEALLCMINIDKIYRVIDNLCINAIKFTNKEGKVKIKTQKSDSFVELHIIDNGIGIAEDKLPLLFKRYTNIRRQGTAGEESTGLGLYIVKQIVDLHLGEIEVSSGVNQGTQFVVKLPRA